MKPVSVRFKCFGPYMDEQFIDFSELEKNGLFLICGETGAGKTTILDAICYALYCESSGGLRGDLSVMRCSLAAKEDETLTEFVFDCNGRRYKFTRSLKYGRKNLNDSHNCLVCEDGVWVPIFENPKATYVNQKAQELGADGVINGSEQNAVEAVKALTDGKGCDLVIETAGTEITSRQCVYMTKKGATIVLVGYSKTGEIRLPMSLALDKELEFKTVFRYRHIYPMAIEAVAAGKVNLHGIVTDIFDFDDIQNAMDKSIADKANIVKAVVKIGK